MKNDNSKPKKIGYEVTLEYDKFPETFAELEKEILEEIEKMKKEILKQVLSMYEEELIKKPTIQIKDRREKRFYTLLGEVCYSRYRVFNRQTKEVSCPVDDWLGLGETGKVSQSLQKELVRLAVDVPYRFVAREIKHWTKNDLGKDAIWSILQSIGKDRWRQKDEQRRFGRYEALPKRDEIVGEQDPAEILCIGMDATYVKSQEKKKRLKKRHDVKVAVLYTGKKKKNGDMTLTNRQTVIQAREERLEQFLGRVVAKGVSHYGLNQETTVLLFGDGDTWIRRFKDFIPQAHYRLDPWHVMEKVKKAFDIETLPKSWIKHVYGNPDALIAEIKIQQQALREDETTDQNQIEQLIQYLQNNRQGLLPWSVPSEIRRKHKNLFTWGSGHVESQIEIAVYDRHKRNRMSWSKKGLQNLSTLREDKLNQHQKPKFICTTPPKPSRINLGSLGVLSLHPQ